MNAVSHMNAPQEIREDSAIGVYRTIDKRFLSSEQKLSRVCRQLQSDLAAPSTVSA